MLCFHHNDLDGRCSAAIVRRFNPGCRFIEMDYRSELPITEVGDGEKVFVVDYSFQRPGDWGLLLKKTGNVVWIDHHGTSIARAKAGEVKEKLGVGLLPGIRRTDACGAALTWRWFNPGPMSDFDAPNPYAVVLVDRWDRWIHHDSGDVLDFVAGMKARDTRPESKVWEELFGPDSDARARMIQRDGAVIRRCETKENADILSQFSYEVEFEGFRCLACNTFRRNSKFFEAADNPYDLFVAYVHDGSKYTVSLYSEAVKVNDLAVKYGGGGHPGAAGFICEELPWKKGSDACDAVETG